MRMRFITANTCMYLTGSEIAVNFSTAQNVSLANAITSASVQRSVFGTSVQGPYGTGQTTQGGGVSRYTG
jgi:hypothetical protein